MKTLIVIVVFLVSIPSYCQSEDACDVFGSVFFVNNQYRADYIVYEEKERGVANISVYKEKAKLMADEPGVRYMSKSENFAKYRLFVTNDSRLADFTIEYIEERAFAGCQ